jgi:restriction endonuclease S subunit
MKKLPIGWIEESVGNFMTEVKDKIDPAESAVTNYVGLEHLQSNGGLIGRGSSSDVKSTKTIFKKYDVLYGKLRPYLNKHTIVEFDGVCSTDILVYRSSNIEAAKYFNFWLGLDSNVQKINSEAKGINLPRVSASIINSLAIPIPPRNEMHRIVTKVESLIARLNQIKARYSSITVITEKFVSSCLAEFYDSRNTLHEFLEEGTQRIGKKWKGVRKVGVSAKDGIIELDTGRKETFENYKIVKPGDFIYNTMRINIGSIAIYNGNDIAITSPDYIVFRVKNTLSPRLLLHYLKSEVGLTEINSNTKGSVRSRLYFRSLASINYPIASSHIQVMAEEFLNWKAKFENTWRDNLSIRLSEIESSILAKAFRGELVEQDSNDGNAGDFIRKGIDVVKKDISEKREQRKQLYEKQPPKARIDKEELGVSRSMVDIPLANTLQKRFGKKAFQFKDLENLKIEYNQVKNSLFEMLDYSVKSETGLKFSIESSKQGLKFKFSES